jgi:hypothetical protein
MLYLSASRIGDFKDCPTRYKLAVIDRIIPDVEPEPFRMGTNWHEIQEWMGQHVGSSTFMNDLIDYLNDMYDQCPPSKTLEEWAVEQNLFLYTAWAYFEHYSDEGVKVIASELPFELPVLHPETGRAVPNVRLRGKIDKIVEYPDRGMFIREYKSTSSSVEDDSSFWKNLRMAMQPSIYYDAAVRLGYSIKGIEYDVWRKPTIKPKNLTQKDSKEVIETGKYLGEKFEIEDYRKAEFVVDQKMMIDGEKVEITYGAKEGTFAIKETPRMYGIRLLHDIRERPYFYFNRREITRSDQDMNSYRWQLYNIHTTLRTMISKGCWYKNEKQCEATFKCGYIPICYDDVDVNERIPDGFHRKEI